MIYGRNRANSHMSSEPVSTKVALVVGARPNYMKAAPLMRAMKRRACFEPVLVYTGQHYDFRMSEIFAPEPGRPEPHSHLAVGARTPTWQTAKIMAGFEKVLEEIQPNLVMVVGDVTSTLACSMVAAQVGIPIAHIESGLRSFDRTMPEEIVRLVTDQLSEYLFTPSPEADENLLREGIAPERIFLVGNVMVDSLSANLKQSQKSDVHNRLGVRPGNYGVLALHRAANVDRRRTLTRMLCGLNLIQKEIPIVFPAHPRILERINEFGLAERLAQMTSLHLVEPLGYFDFLAIMSQSILMLTDSGGIQEETTALGTPCLTLRDNTERPITITEGTNTLVGTDVDLLVAETRKILNGCKKIGRVPDLWDGRSADRIADVLVKAFNPGETTSVRDE